jgi:sec-independent protein translocase protein TatC
MREKELSIIDHLGELRNRLTIVFLGFLFFFSLGFIFVKDLYQWFVKDLTVELIILGPTDILWIYLNLSMLVALVGTLPLFTYQLMKFILPALQEKERKLIYYFVPGVFVLFIVGLSFGYFFVRPMAFNFLQTISSDFATTSYTVEKYFSFVFNLTLPFGILFELPVFVLFFTYIGLLNPIILIKSRRIAYFVLVVIAVSVTPPDFLSDITLMVPLLFLYEMSIQLSKIMYQRRQKRIEKEVEEQL